MKSARSLFTIILKMPPLCLSLLNSPGAAAPAVLAPSLSSSSSLEVAARRGAAADVETPCLLEPGGYLRWFPRTLLTRVVDYLDPNWIRSQNPSYLNFLKFPYNLDFCTSTICFAPTQNLRLFSCIIRHCREANYFNIMSPIL